MMARLRIRYAPALVLLAALALAGCDGLRYLFYLGAPALPKEKVPAEYDKLPGHSLAVVVQASPETQYEQRNIQLDIALAVGKAIQDRVDKVTLVPARTIRQYQREHIDWDQFAKTRLGRNLGADYVLLIAVERFTTLEPGSLELRRGRATVHATLYQTLQPERKAKVWGTRVFRATYPEEATTGGVSERTIRYETIQRLAGAIARAFYEYEVER